MKKAGLVFLLVLAGVFLGCDKSPKFTAEEKAFIIRAENIQKESIKISQESAAISAELLRETITADEANTRLDALTERLTENNIKALELSSDPLANSVAEKVAQGAKR